jgi:hypothetical protein
MLRRIKLGLGILTVSLLRHLADGNVLPQRTETVYEPQETGRKRQWLLTPVARRIIVMAISRPLQHIKVRRKRG